MTGLVPDGERPGSQTSPEQPEQAAGAFPSLPLAPPSLPLRAPAGLAGLPTTAPLPPPVASQPGAVAPGLPVPGTPVSPAAPAPVTSGYIAAGALTAEQLLNGHPTMFAHLDEKIVEIRNWVQDQLTQKNLADDIFEARHNKAKHAEMSALIDRLVLSYISKESVIRGEDRRVLIAAVINEIIGLSSIEPLWGDPRITEVMVNGPTAVYAEIGGKVVKVPGARFRDSEHLLEVCQQILQPMGRRVDVQSALADGRLPDGSRVNVVHTALSPGGPLLTIRRFPDTVWTLKDLVENGSVTEEMACELAWLIYYKCSTVVVGGTGAGKTSLLNALSSCIPREDRIITVEDSLELRLHPDAHVAPMEARPASASGSGEVRIRDLVKNALRMRPDRIVVGEVRDASALDMLQAMNTGHEGSMTTVHANGAEEAVNRLAVLVAQGGEIPEDKVQWLIGDAVDLFVIQRRYEDGTRRVQGIYEVPSMREGMRTLRPIPLWEWVQTSTAADGSFVGNYEKRTEISEELVLKRRLQNFPKFTMADVYRMSELPANMKKGSN